MHCTIPYTYTHTHTHTYIHTYIQNPHKPSEVIFSYRFSLYGESESEVKTSVRTWVSGGWVAAQVPDLKKFFLKILTVFQCILVQSNMLSPNMLIIIIECIYKYLKYAN